MADIVLAPSAHCRDVATCPDSLDGRIARRVIREAEAVCEPAIGPASLIAEGDSVDVVVSTGALRLTVRGAASAAAALGERVWVRLGPKRRLQGIVTAHGLVVAE